jgi:hypothetical protein
MKSVLRISLVASTLSIGVLPAHATPTCTDLGYGSLPGAKANKLFLYFPTADDATYPDFHIDAHSQTTPAHAFNVADLSSYTGTAAALESAIFDVVTDDYCEFNVEVLQTTTAPTGPAPRRNTIAIGTDSEIWADAAGSYWTWGLAQNVDTGDATAIDFARVWAGTYQGTAGVAGGALNGANSTLERWARSIGGTAAHEGGHNYGLGHNDGVPVAAGEDALTRHIMASGSHYSDEQRAGYRRHFSNHEYEVLAANVGLSVQTMWNWDFVNPNAQTATKVRINFLSTQPSMTVSGPYTGNLSPWSAPTVSGSLGNQVFNGVTYQRYAVTWSTGQSWSGGNPGEVLGGAGFHVGTGFSGVDYNTTNPIIITSVDLLDSSGNTLALHPRLTAFDSGALDSNDGSFSIRAFSLAAPLLILSDLRVLFLPKLLSINAMLSGVEKLTDIMGDANEPWARSEAPLGKGVVTRKGLRIPIATMAKGPHFIETVGPRDCKQRGDRSNELPDTAGCKFGTVAALFPATVTYITATVTDPQVKHWDREKKTYVVGPVKSRIFYQLGGRHPDLNKNGIDDFVEIAKGKAQDRNKDGVIDAVQRKEIPGRKDIPIRKRIDDVKSER